jgi:hypothetical protein
MKLLLITLSMFVGLPVFSAGFKNVPTYQASSNKTVFVKTDTAGIAAGKLAAVNSCETQLLKKRDEIVRMDFLVLKVTDCNISEFPGLGSNFENVEIFASGEVQFIRKP